ncbi:MAG TPA: HK97 gp10 family phage protein [Tissierellaceae bacterium]|nr:HK97 gp10 family phage protein [Tissierellaceae bacterium]
MPEYKDIENLSDRTIRKLNKIVKVAAMELFKSVIMMTPVDTGRARGNWQCTMTRPADGVIDSEQSEEATIAKMVETTLKSSISKGIFLTNNLPYIQKLEYGGYGQGPKTEGGYSKQAPAGMVRVSLDRIQKDLKEIIADVIEKEQ